MNESYNWLLGIIDSCKNRFQMECCITLSELFRRMYIQEEGYGPLYDDLLIKIEAKDALLTV